VQGQDRGVRELGHAEGVGVDTGRRDVDDDVAEFFAKVTHDPLDVVVLQVIEGTGGIEPGGDHLEMRQVR
jgi:hypothetical protein